MHDTALHPSPPEANTGYWKFTKHTITQNIRTGHTLRDGFVSEMDPDAINRGDGVVLASDDTGQFCFYFSSFFVFLSLFYPQSYEKSLLQALYGYIRAGRLSDVIEVCCRVHQPWRAASICGSLLFQWKAICEFPPLCFTMVFFLKINISSATERKLEEDDEDEHGHELESSSGNQNRKLWKSTCVQAALSVRLLKLCCHLYRYL